VQCRWFESPVPDKEDQDTEKTKASKVRHSVHFGEARICDPPAENNERKSTPISTIDERKQSAPLNKVEDEHKKDEKPKKQSIYSSSNSIPIIKVAKVTNLNKSFAENASEPHKQSLGPSRSGITIKVYAKCLAPDIEYKTVIVGETMSSRELIWLLLSKYRMKHRDPKLFYLTMDVTVKKTGIPIKRTMVLEDDARPAQLRSCNPWGECKFSLQMRKGGLVRVYDSVLVEELKYKCLCISEETTVEDVISMLLNCYGIEDTEEVSRFCIYETGTDVERKCNQTEKPLQLQSYWTNSSPYHKFVLRRSTRSVSNQVKRIKLRVFLNIYKFQFPEETCVDESDRLLWGYASHDSSSSTCSEIENAFYPSPAGLDSSSEISIREQYLAPVFSPTLPQVAFSTFGARNTQDIVQKSAFLPMIRPVPSRGSFYPRVIKKSSFGSVTSATASEESDNFFYI